MAKKKSASPTKPTKAEVAKMIVLDELGESYRSIGRMLGRSNHTVKKYLNSEAYLKDPAVQGAC
jgi:predicted transcriptional regulator